MLPRRVYSCVLAIVLAAPLSAQAPSPDVAARQALADSLFKAQQYAKARPIYEQLTRADTTSLRDWYQLGFTEAQLGHYAAGVVAFEHAAKLGRGPGAPYNVAAMFARLGQTDSAITWLSRAVQVGFSDKNLLDTDEDLASIRSDKRFPQIVYNATHAATPCADSASNHQFDFWIGEWDVLTAQGGHAGTSSVQSVAGGCAVYENWTSLRGGTGKSLSAWNAAKKQWQQYYVGQADYVLEYTTGEFDGKSIIFHLEPYQLPSGATALGRLTFTPMPDGVVRQHSEQSTDGGKTWTTQYDLYYHRKTP